MFHFYINNTNMFNKFCLNFNTNMFHFYINNKFCLKRYTIFLHIKIKYLNKIETNKLGTKLKQINIYGY